VKTNDDLKEALSILWRGGWIRRRKHEVAGDGEAWICSGAMDGSMERRYGYVGSIRILDLAI
jgi:hypothetical protein